MPQRVTISVVTFNDSAVIGVTLDSLIEAVRSYGFAEIIVVDNNSTDTTHAILSHYKTQCPFLTVLYNSEDVGFGRGHNRAIRGAQGRYHAICNPDLVVPPDSIGRLVEFMEANLDVGLVAPKFLNQDGSTQHLNRRYPTVLDLFIRRFWPESLHFLVKQRCDYYVMKDVGYDKVCDVPVASGAFMFCRTAVLKKVDGFDPRYFLYFEDTDLARKIQEGGHRTVYFPEVAVTHKWDRANHRRWRVGLTFAVSGIRYFNKWGWQFL